MHASLDRPPDAPAWVPVFLSLRQEMDAWIAASAPFQRCVPFLADCDDGAFLTSWLCHFGLTRDPAILALARHLRDGFAAWAAAHLPHGAFPPGEIAHQGTLYTGFLLRLWHAAPDETTASLILDAAEHVGNWVPGVPPWYDWGEQRFLSSTPAGAPSRGAGGPDRPDHFRFIQLALGAHLISGDARYLELSTGWATRRATELLADEDSFGVGPPAAHDGLRPLGAGTPAGARLRRGVRVEPYVAAGAVDVLLDLHSLTGEALYANAARVLCSALVEDCCDPTVNAHAALLHRYRLAAGDTSFDAQLVGQLAGLPEQAPGETVMVIDQAPAGLPPGVTPRPDTLRWGYRDETGQLVPELFPSPAALMLGYQISGSVELAVKALGLAAARLRLARESLRDGRGHSASGRSIAAVAAGHAREAGYGNVTGCLYALAHAALRFVGHERPGLTLMPAGDGLPAEGAALCRSVIGSPPLGAVWHEGQMRVVTADEPASP